MKETICTIAGVVGSFIAGLFGVHGHAAVVYGRGCPYRHHDRLRREIIQIPERQAFQQILLARSGKEMRLPAAGSGGGTSGYHAGHNVYPGCSVHRVYRQRVNFHHRKCRAAGCAAAGYFDKGN